MWAAAFMNKWGHLRRTHKITESIRFTFYRTVFSVAHTEEYMLFLVGSREPKYTFFSIFQMIKLAITNECVCVESQQEQHIISIM